MVSHLTTKFCEVGETYVSPWAQICAVDGVLMETLPLLELSFSKSLILWCIPNQHLRLVVDTSGLADSFDHARRVVKQIVSVNNADLDALRSTVGAICLSSLTSRLGADYSLLAKVVKELAKLRVASLVLAEVVPASQLAQGRLCAAVVAGNAVFRVADEEDKVVCCEKVLGKDGRVAIFNSGVEGVGFAGAIVSRLHGREFGCVCSNAAAVVGHRRADGCRSLFAYRRDPVLRHILDEGAFPLYPLARVRQHRLRPKLGTPCRLSRSIA